jgi:hypothetical protein
MTLLTNLCMEFLPKFYCLGLVTFQKGNFMKAVAITAVGGVWISCED